MEPVDRRKMGRTTCLSAMIILLASLLTAPVMAEEIPLNVLLERHVEALGGQDAIDGIRSIVSTGEIETEFWRGGEEKDDGGAGEKKSATLELESYIQSIHGPARNTGCRAEGIRTVRTVVM
jgi:hypothetical protein